MHEHKIHLTVKTPSGDYHHEFPRHETLRRVLDETIEHFKIQPVPGGSWQLQFEGQPLDLFQTIEHTHLPDHAVLTLVLHEHKIHLTIETLAGKYKHAFNAHDTLQHVVDATLAHLKIKPAPDDIWQLQYQGAILTLSLTIEQASLPDHAVLTLATKEGGGGSPWTLR